MNIVIVPSHNQGKYIDQIVKGYEKQTMIPDLLLFVFDRCSDDSLNIISNVSTSLNLRWIVKETGDNFSAGMTRDFGVTWVKENIQNYSMILFTDGDCIPSEKVIEKHSENLSKTSKSIVSCGMRKMQTVDGSFEDDKRNNPKWVNGYTFTDRNGRLILSREFTLNNLFTYSCNLAFNNSAIDLCCNINKHLTNSDRVFSPMFDGSWGGEDDFISHCLYRTGNWIVLTDKDCYVEHYFHESSKKEINKKNLIVQELSKRLEQLILKGDMEGPIQNCYKSFNINFGYDIKNDIKNTYSVEGLDQELLVYLENIVERYNMNFEIPLKYMFTNNIKSINTEKNNRQSDFSLAHVKQFSGYLKFYLNNDNIEFYDDVSDFKFLKVSGDCAYCRLDK